MLEFIAPIIGDDAIGYGLIALSVAYVGWIVVGAGRDIARRLRRSSHR